MAGFVPFAAQETGRQGRLGHVIAFAAKLEFEYSAVKRQCFLDIVYFKRNVIEPYGARPFVFRHKLPQ
jgi:hypothetical protein